MVILLLVLAYRFAILYNVPQQGRPQGATGCTEGHFLFVAILKKNKITEKLWHFFVVF